MKFEALKTAYRPLCRSLILLVIAWTLGITQAVLAAGAFEWPRAQPGDVGISEELLSELDRNARRGDYGRLKNILVSRHGKLVYEEYYNGHGPDEVFPLYSVTKSWASALIGIAVRRGDIEGIDQSLESLLPQYRPSFQQDPAKRSIRLRDLLTMRHGLEWDEWSTWFTDPVNPVNRMTRSADWWSFVLARPMTAEPDTTFRYSTGTSNLLGGVIYAATDQSAIEYAREHMFSVLDIDDYHIEVDLSGSPRGTGITTFQPGLTPTGHGLWLKATDLAKIGQLYLDRGVWNTQRVFSSDWVDLSWGAYSDAQTDPHIFPEGISYGLQWWGMEVPGEDGTIQVHMAHGFADQFIFVVPSLDLVVVSNADNGSYSGDDLADAIRDGLLAAIDPGFDPLNDGGLTGSWFSPDLPHQGFMLEIVPTTGQVVIYWMTFEPETGKQQWMIAVGRLSGRRAVLEFLRPVNGAFVGDTEAELTSWGEAEIEFQDCTNASLAFASVDGHHQGTITLRRLTPNTVCRDI